MSGNLEYTKKFIILKNNFCNIPGKKPKGHVKIEVKGLKGSLSFSVENAEASQNYDVVLISGNKTYSPGKVYTEKAGKGREDINFNISDLEAYGIRINSLSGIVLAREENVLLGGYMGRDDQSLERYINNLESNLLTHQPSDEPVVFNEKPETKQSGDGIVVEIDEPKLAEPEEKVEFVASEEEKNEEFIESEELVEDIDEGINDEALDNEELIEKVDDEISGELLEDEEISQEEILDDGEFIEGEELLSKIDDEINGVDLGMEKSQEEISLEKISDEECIKAEEIIHNLEDEISNDQALEGDKIALDESSDDSELTLEEEVDDGLNMEREADFEEKPEIKVEFIETEEFQKDEDLEVSEEFFEPSKDFKEPSGGLEFIENDVQMDDDVKTYVRTSLDLDKAVDDETYSYDDYKNQEYEEIAALDLDREISDDNEKPKVTEPSTYSEVEFSEDDILLEEECDCTKINIDVDKVVEDDDILSEEEGLSQDEEVIEEELISIDEVALEGDLPTQDEIINDVKLEDPLEEGFNLEDYDKKIIEQYENVFDHKPVESNGEVVKINHVDYENNRRMIQKNQTTDYILNILKYFPEEDPLRQHLKGYKWWRIDFQDEAKGFLPYFNYVLGGKQKMRASSNYITARELMNIYNHYLFGMYSQNEEVDYYIYAIPGAFYKDEHPHGGVTGFNTWFEGNEVVGYWLIYIDALTGEVIYPLNPMIPMD